MENIKKVSVYCCSYRDFSGETTYFTVYNNQSHEFFDDRVFINDVVVENKNDGRTETMSLIIDENTVFDENFEKQYFENYSEGDTPLQWFLKNKDTVSDEQYFMTLMGVFTGTVTGNHVDSIITLGWWD